MKRSLKVALLLLLAAVLPSAALASISVSVSPSTVHVQPGGQQQFVASVFGTSNSVVIWSLSGTGCSANACGQITNTGLYLAPSTTPSSNVITVTATSLADVSVSGSAAVILGSSSDIKIFISPPSASVVVGTQARFSATVTGTTITGVTWSLTGPACNQSACGSITSTGLYNAPPVVPSSPQVTVTATSVADPSRSSSAILTILPPVAVKVLPATARVVEGTTQQFTADVTGTTNTAVTWTLSGSGCSGATCGTITSSGLYTAPNAIPSPANVTITATSAADTTKSSTAVATIIPPIVVTVAPSTAQVVAGKQQQFSATVTGTTNTSVTWSVSGAGCSGTACGTVTASGLYTAPNSVPSPAQVRVTATSVANSAKSSSASVTILPPVAVTVSPSTVQVLAGKQQQFSANVTGTTNTAVTWSLSGAGCSGATCGTITTGGLYTAPAVPPSPALVTVTATSVADPTKSDKASVTVLPLIGVTVSPASAQVVAGKQQQFTATVTGASNSQVTWSVSGSGCSGATCGAITTGGLYTAPANVPAPPQVTVTATSVADPTKSGTATVTVLPPVGVTVSPSSAQLVTGKTQQFSATVTGTSNSSVTWSVSGSGCSGATCGTITSAGLYTAPSAVPSPAQVFVTATSVADPTKSGTATVTVLAPVAVTVSPSSAQVVVSTQQQFKASVTGSTNTAVTWTLSGPGCSGAGCGAITSGGLYTAPATIPSPAQVTVTATSVADPTKSSTAMVTVVALISVTVTPNAAQVTVGGSQQFTASVHGMSNTNVTWSIAGTGCSGAGCGSINTTGLYTAPSSVPNPAQVFVTATSVQDPTKSGTATVTVLPLVIVHVAPKTSTVQTTKQQQFLVSVSGTSNADVTWTVAGPGCSGAACGTVSSTGLYTAPSTVPSPNQVTVTATSVVNTKSSDSALVTIVPPVTVTVAPRTSQLLAGGHEQFTATVTGTTNTAVTWTVTGKGCSGAACGLITSSGLYNAPGNVPSPPQVTITATSVADPTKSGTAVITLIPPVAVSVTPSVVQVVTGNTQQFTASVTGTSNTGVTWTVSGSGCSGSACGTVNASGLYTAPTTIPNPALVTVTATSIADTTKSASAQVTVIKPVTITVSPTKATVAVNNTVQFQATVVGSSNTGVDWSVSGAGCSGSACGTISSSGLYTAPAAVPSVATVIVTASAQVDPAESASATITIVPNEDSRLNGQYAFQFTGFDSNGVYQVAGEFTANGSGKVTAGLEDVTNTSGSTNLSLIGTYEVNGDNRGSLTLTSALGSHTFRFALNGTGTKGRMIAFDGSGVRGSGSFEQQDTSAFQQSALKGPYVFSLAGQDSNGKRIGALGVMELGGTGVINGGTMDVNDNGSVPPTFAVSGIYRADSTGRGTVGMDVPGFAGGSFNFAFYIVSANKVFMVSTNALTSNNPVFAGPVERQTGAPFLTSNFDGPTTFSLSGRTGNSSQTTVGRITFDGASQPLAEFDQNTAGVITSGNVLTGAYDVEVTGRGTINLDNSNGSSQVIYFYAIAPNQAFLMDASTAYVGMGELDPQTTQPPFTNGSILGTYLLGSGEPLASGATLYSGESNFDGGTGASGATVSGLEDISLATSLKPDEAILGKYSVSASSSNGRAILLQTSPSGEIIVLWITSPTEVLGMELDTTNSKPVVLHFEQ